MSGLQLPFGVQPVNAVPVDYYKYDSDDAPYANVAAANSNIPSGVRYQGQTVILDVSGSAVEYWYKDGTADNDLVEKETGGASDHA